MNSAKKRVILAVTLAEPGGVQSFILRFAIWLQKQGYEVLVLAGDGTWLFERLREAGIPAKRLRHMGRAIRPIRDLLALWELTHFLRKEKTDAIHLNSTKMGIIGSLAARRSHVPRIVYRIGGWVFLEPLPSFTKFLYRALERLTAPLKHILICVHPGDEAVAHATRILPQKKLLTIPNGIDLESFDPSLLSREEARKKLGFESNLFFFGTVAHLYPAKDLPRYLEACALVSKAHPEARFILIGEGPERLKIEEKQKALGLEGVAHLLGNKENASSLLKAFDAFVLPSAKEGMPWSLLEAMAAELPCLATDVGANAWMLQKEAGWIVPTQNPDRLAEAMIHVLEHPSEARLRGQNARKKIQETFRLSETLAENERTLLS